MKNIFFASIMTLGLISCGETPNKIDSDMINNSRSADQPAQDPSQLAGIEFEETKKELRHPRRHPSSFPRHPN